MLDSIERSRTLTDIAQIREELAEAGYIKRTQKQGKRQTVTNQFNEYQSVEGYKIIVGKNNRQNDYLTTVLASKNDLWFHVKNIAGSHVIVFCGGKEVSDRTVYFAATLAAENSLHSLLADRFGIEPETRKCPANMAYDRMLTRLEKEECAAYTFASLLPCYWVYAHIGLLIFRQHTAADNPYADWIATYGDPSFQTDAEQFRTLCDSCAAIQTDSTLHRMTSYFLHSTALELRFWRDCYRIQDR